MKFLIIIFIFISKTIVFAQDFTIVAVGQAEQEKEKLVVSATDWNSDVSEKYKRMLTQIGQIIIDDFKFYKHLYVVEESLKEVSNNLVQLKKTGYSFAVFFNTKLQNENLLLSTKLAHIGEMKEYFISEIDISTGDVRAIAHKISNMIYQKITGKESIFNKKIIFLSDKTSLNNEIRKELYMMDFDGKRIQRLTYNNAMIISPAISPDNKKVMFSMYQGRWRTSSQGKVHKVQNLNLYLYDLATHKTVKISGKKGINSGAIFTQNPDEIYLTMSFSKNADIYKMNLKSKTTTRVTTHLSDDVDPHINSDGSLMTFLSGRPGKAMIYTLDPNGIEKDVKRISFVGRFNASPRFSPDGKEIVFSSWVDNRFDIYKIDSNGKNLVRLTKNFGSNEEPMFSPDGQFIIFTSQRVINSKKAVQDIYIMNREGEIVSKLTSNMGQNFTPRWTK